jgi:DNA polymerase-3 subunit alpha
MYLDECRRTAFPDSTEARPHVGVEVRPPDVNLSYEDFAVVYGDGEPRDGVHGHVRFGLKAIKGAGEGAIRAIVAERAKGGPFRDLFDFCDRVDLRAVNRATVEALIKGGAFDGLHGVEARAALAATVEDAMRSAQGRSEDRRVGQMTFFGDFEAPAAAAAGEGQGAGGSLRKVAPWERMQALAFEKEALGFHVSGHPLDGYRDEIATFCSGSVERVSQMPQDASVVVGGMLTRVRTVVAKTGKSAGQAMAMFTVADQGASIEGVLFAQTFAAHAQLMQLDRVVVMVARLDHSRGSPQLVVDRVIPIEDAAQHLATRIEISLDAASSGDRAATGALQMASGILKQASGSVAALHGRPVDVHLRVAVDGRSVTLRSGSLRVVPERALLAKVAATLDGVGKVRVIGGYVPQRERPRWSARREAAHAD